MKKFLLTLAAAALAAVPLCAQNDNSSSQATTTNNTTQSSGTDATAGTKAKNAAKDVGNDTKQTAKDVKYDTTGASSEEQQKALKRLDDAAAELNKLTNAGDQGIPDTVLSKAKCVAIIPSLKKGGFVFGAEYGRGVATCRTNGRWSAPAFLTLTGGSWGAQIGGEAVDLVMFFMDQKGAEQLMSANWKIGGDAGIAAGPFGREAAASTDWKFNTGILTYSKAKGAFVGATLNGANVSEDKDATKGFYGNLVNFREVLSGKVPPPPQAHQFLASIRRDFREAQASR
ncbi:MAG TPA: lipid-binding SYLF domain-containing protein [Candidatus Acidoferrales bacterium]|nr:lipid-binding SYLF domain-containing protein [Candidatus Acidoferrales bacterium]